MAADDKFCLRCGARAPAPARLCAACRNENPADGVFCVHCGGRLNPSSAGSPIDELKYVTLLRADLADSTGLIAGCDPEQGVRRLELPLTAMRAAIRRFGGIIAKELGDGVLAVFGAPVADDNHAPLACHAALELVRRIDALGDARLQVRVGLHAGLVVARVITTEYSSLYDFGGPALSLVERLQVAAEPGGIYASEACRKLAEGEIAFTALAPKRLKGFADPVPLHRVAGAGEPSRWRVRAARGVSRFVGRDGELATLARAAGAVTPEGGRVAVLIGDPGVGKSRLAHEFLGPLRDTGWRVIEAECSPTAQAAPYGALKSLMTASLGPPLTEGAQTGPATDPRAGLTAIWRAALDALFDRPVADVEWTALEPPLRRRAIADACRAVIGNITRAGRTVLVIEDVHWIDQASDAAIEALTSLSSRHQLLILFTSRPQAAPSWLDQRNAMRLWLRPLDADGGRDLLDALLGPAPSLAALKPRLLSHTGGVPLFIEEVCRHLLETGALSGERGAVTLDRPFEDLGVPPTIQGAIAAHIDRLPKPERALLQLAAAIGPRASLSTLSGVAGVPATVLSGQLTALHAAELLIEASLLPEHTYAFPHDLVRQVTYEAMLTPARLRLHREILGYLEEAAEGQAEDQSAVLCHHAVRAEAWEKGYRYARSVAQKCVARSALADAVNYYEIAIDALDRLPMSREREERAIDLRIEARLAFPRLGRLDRWLELAKEAEQRAITIDDRARRVAAMAVHAAALNFYGTPLEAITVGEEVLRHAEDLNNRGWLNSAEYGLGQAYFVAGRYREAERMFGRAYAQLAGPNPEPSAGMTARGALLLCCMMKTAVHIALGETQPAEFFQHRAEAIARESRRPYDHIAAAYSTGLFLAYRGDYTEAQAQLEESLAFARQHELGQFIPVIACQLGLTYLEIGLIERARAVLTEAKSEAEIVGHTSIALRATTHLAVALCRCGEPQAALQMVQTVRDVARQKGFKAVEAETLYAEANVLAMTHPHNNSLIINCLHSSIVIAAAMESKIQLVKSNIMLECVLKDQGNVNLSFFRIIDFVAPLSGRKYEMS
jgi:class 3 adenylate cyclase/tetratricopeptide (TPR) repeat protein